MENCLKLSSFQVSNKTEQMASTEASDTRRVKLPIKDQHGEWHP